MKLPLISEDEFLKQVTSLARLYGWKFVHFRPARLLRGGWRTALSGDVGWPDLFLVRVRTGHAKALALELKAEGGKLTPEQRQWLDLLSAAGIEALVVRPSDWHRVVRLLSEEGP